MITVAADNIKVETLLKCIVCSFDVISAYMSLNTEYTDNAVRNASMTPVRCDIYCCFFDFMPLIAYLSIS